MNNRVKSNRIVVQIDAEIQEAIPFFLELRKKNIADIMTALEGKDFEHIKRLGHNIKGSGGSYGFDELSRIGRDLEKAALAQNENATRNLTVELEDYLANVEIVYV
ncbi:Hpt domain-containing protein [Geobacter sp. AOG1]|uniref:Hpt domain-containing protein n=1 Tax=Geobacter sp. AOG1 TaxID=1566346 RepID=UPI001CC60ADC|nr:Hpt domain-containing protein [Geobacter sp. AOG1]GFE58235.1 histidine phosphotransfer domain-containing protein [Geobacter sp. AOG1]